MTFFGDLIWSFIVTCLLIGVGSVIWDEWIKYSQTNAPGEPYDWERELD